MKKGKEKTITNPTRFIGKGKVAAPILGRRKRNINFLIYKLYNYGLSFFPLI